MTNDKNRNMQVVLRVRPLSRHELEQNQSNIVRVADANTIIFDPDEEEDEFFFHGTKQTHRDITKRVNKKLTMIFDQVFDNRSTNANVFDHSMRPLVSSVMNGYNCSAFVYGATGAGKTHTMLGNEENPGITYLTMKYLFEQIEAFSDERKFDIGISYLEVYNEQVMNLLTKTGPLKLREDSSGVVVGGLALKPIYNAEDLLSLLALGNRNRTQHPTDANAESSRSHAIFQVHIRMTNRKTGEKRTVKLSMIDLAGSERGSSTKCVGQRFKEGASINKSLLALGNCINKLADGSKHIPYRDSNMTRILKDSLGGNCQTVMIANISPSSLTYEDTYNTLKYASRAQQIRTSTLTKNVFKTNLPKEYYIRKLTDSVNEVDHLQKRIKILENQSTANANQNNNNDNQVAFEAIVREVVKWQQRFDKIYADLHTAQETYFSLYSKEKILKFRSKQKEITEETKKLFNMNGDFLNRDINRAEASIGKFGKQIETFQADKAGWLKRFKDGKANLVQLKKQIVNDKIKVMLGQYLKYKDSELEKAQMNSKSEHYLKIIRFYSIETEHYHKTVQISSAISQESYLLLSANLMLTDDLQSKYDQLYKINDGQRSVKFTGEDCTKTDNDEYEIDTNQNIDDITFENGIEEMNVQDVDSDDVIFTMPQPVRAKRSLNTDDVPCSLPKRFASTSAVHNDQQNLNSTQVLETHYEDDERQFVAPTIDSTTLLKSKKSVAINKRTFPISRALKETNPNINKPFLLSKSAVRPVINGKPALNLKEKENKRFVLTVRKSPRRNSPSHPINKMLKSKPSDNVLKRLKDNPIRTKPVGK